MKSLSNSLVHTILSVSVFVIMLQMSYGQCGAGYTSDTINWDMQYFSPNYLPNPNGSNSIIAIGKNAMRLSWSGANTFRGGLISDHTGEAGGFGFGRDLKFIVGTGTDTLTFDQEVQNLKFSVFDVDISHVMNVTATNALGAAVNITLARVSGTYLTITNSGTASATATSASNAQALNATTGTVNVTIPSAVKKVVIKFTKASGTDSIYISDISACVPNSNWVSGYQAISTPEIGQPSYVLAAYGTNVNAVDLVNNTSDVLFSDTTISGINSLAYDPYRQVVYYTDNARVGTNVSIFQYNVKTGVKTTFVNDVTAFGMQVIPSYGMGSAGASFYDGYLFIGQEPDSFNFNHASIWRFELDNNGNAKVAERVWSKMGYYKPTGGYKYDWSDFVVNDGILYNFSTANAADANTRIEHIDMDRQYTVLGYTSTAAAQAQTSIDYLGKIYNMKTGGWELYNGTGGFGATVSYGGYSGTILDASESFKYPYDFGDAPIGYGKVFHRFDVKQRLKIGSLVDFEINGKEDNAAFADDTSNTGVADDEDGVTNIPTFSVADASNSIQVSVTNTTGANATLYGYIDFNIDGDFLDAGERSQAMTVPSGTTSVTLTWVGLSGGKVGQSFIRLRLGSNAAQVQSPAGYSADGEVEDYTINIEASFLPVELVSFTAKAETNGTTSLNWQTASEYNNAYYEIQRSADATKWDSIGVVYGTGNSNQLKSYLFTDNEPLGGINYYRLKQVDYDGQTEYTAIASVRFAETQQTQADKNILLYPNPSRGEIWFKSDVEIKEGQPLMVDVYDFTGDKIMSIEMQNTTQKIELNDYPAGIYFIKIDGKTHKILKI